MRYKIEYLLQQSIVHRKSPFASDIDGVTAEARKGGVTAKTLFGANGFQIRDMQDEGRIVLLEELPKPA